MTKHTRMSTGTGFGLFMLGVLSVIMVLAVLPATASGNSSNSVSQIVLSCTVPPPESHSINGCASSELVTTPPIIQGTTLYFIGGFWIWCQSAIGTGTPYGT